MTKMTFPSIGPHHWIAWREVRPAKGKAAASANEIDFFATFYNGECYLIPQSECSNEKTLRIKPPKNGQRKGVSFLEDYQAKEIISKL